MSSIVSTNAEGRLLESAEERSRITQLIVVANYKMRWTRQTARERIICAVILRCLKKMTRKVCNRNYSNEVKTMRDTESQMQRAPVHEDLTIFTIESIKDLEPRYYSFQ